MTCLNSVLHALLLCKMSRFAVNDTPAVNKEKKMRGENNARKLCTS